MKVVKCEFSVSDVAQYSVIFLNDVFRVSYFGSLELHLDLMTRIEEALKFQDINNSNDILVHAPIQKKCSGGGGGSEG